MNIAIIGAGTRGIALAQLLALGNHYIALYDQTAPTLQKAKQRIDQTLDRGVSAGKLTADAAERSKKAIIPVNALEQCTEADFIFEAITETMDAKKPLFERLDRIAQRSTILITTSATLSPTVIASAAKRFPERVLAIHFYEPITMQKLAELIPADHTDSAFVERSEFLLRQMGKTIVRVKDRPGTIIDRLTTVYTGEALRILGEGDTSPETLDKLMGALDLSPAPLHLIDSLGADKHLQTTERLYNAYYHDPRFRPHLLQRQMVDSNRLGRKTKQGFFSYADTPPTTPPKPGTDT